MRIPLAYFWRELDSPLSHRDMLDLLRQFKLHYPEIFKFSKEEYAQWNFKAKSEVKDWLTAFRNKWSAIPKHNCWDNSVTYEFWDDGHRFHGFECGICGAFLQAS